MAPLMVEVVVWMSECGPKMQLPVVTLLRLVPAQSLCNLRELHGQLTSAGQHLGSVLVGCSFQWSSARMEVPGEEWGLQSPMEHQGFAGERLSYVGATSRLSPSSPLTGTAPSTSAPCSCVDQATSPWPRFAVGIVYPWWRWPNISQEEPPRLSDPRCLLRVPQVC